MSKYTDNLRAARGFITDMDFYLKMAELYAETAERKSRIYRMQESLDNIRGLIDEDVRKEDIFEEDIQVSESKLMLRRMNM